MEPELHRRRSAVDLGQIRRVFFFWQTVLTMSVNSNKNHNFIQTFQDIEIYWNRGSHKIVSSVRVSHWSLTECSWVKVGLIVSKSLDILWTPSFSHVTSSELALFHHLRGLTLTHAHAIFISPTKEPLPDSTANTDYGHGWNFVIRGNSISCRVSSHSNHRGCLHWWSNGWPSNSIDRNLNHWFMAHNFMVIKPGCTDK